MIYIIVICLVSSIDRLTLFETFVVIQVKIYNFNLLEFKLILFAVT